MFFFICIALHIVITSKGNSEKESKIYRYRLQDRERVTTIERSTKKRKEK